jgi:hypothetical protein
MKCSTFRVIFLYNEDFYISKTVQQQVRIRSKFFTVEFASGTPRQHRAPSLGLSCRCGSQWLIKAGNVETDSI